MSVQIPTEDFDAQSQLNQKQHHDFTKIMQTIDVGTTTLFCGWTRGNRKNIPIPCITGQG